MEKTFLKEFTKPIAYKVQKLVDNGELLIVPCGYRCYTRIQLNNKLKLGETMPFDNGIFTPHSLSNMLKNKKIELKYPDPEMKTHTVCKKMRNEEDFELSSYEEINSEIRRIQRLKNRDDSWENNILSVLDSSQGYYTYDKKNKIVLVHYNWFNSKLHRNKNRKQLIDSINLTINRRMKRLFERCGKSKNIFFVNYGPKTEKLVSIGEETHDISDQSELKETINNIFGDKGTFCYLDDLVRELKEHKII